MIVVCKGSIMYGQLCSLYYDVTEKYACQKELDFYASYIQKDDLVLEAMSGSGRLLLPLIQRGYMIHGIDSSPHMIQRCKLSAQALQVDPVIYEQRLETMHIDHRYTTVIIAVGSFQLIVEPDDALQALQKLRAHMHTGGNLFLDLFIPDLSGDVRQRSSYSARVDDHTTISFSAFYEVCHDKQYIDAFCTYELSVDALVQAREQEHMRFVWYTDEQLSSLLDQAGFDVVSIHTQSFRPAGVSRIMQACAR